MNYDILTYNALTYDIDVDDNVNNLLVITIGYEQRSAYIAKQYIKYILEAKLKLMVLLFDDYNKCDESEEILAAARQLGYKIVSVKYNDNRKVVDSVISELNKQCVNRLFIDYSSMPRSWYCGLSKLIASGNLPVESAVFWYAMGQYKAVNDEFPNTCVQDEMEVFSGRASLRPLNQRSHLFCLGYDNIRTHAVMSVIDPSFYAIIIASPTDQPDIRDKVISKNAQLINAASYQIELPIEDFRFMVSKLTDVSNNLVSKGDVILVPDGPKPLIMACSLVPEIVKKYGIVCLHVKRHSNFYVPVDVSATGVIYGFKLQGKTVDHE